MSGKYYFNAPLQLPQGANLALENSSGNKLFFDSNSSMASSYNLVFPAADGTDGQALITDGSGNLRFGTVSGGAASSIASNAVTNSTSGDIIFTTDSGDATLGTDSGNTKILALGGSNTIIFSAAVNEPLNIADASNLSMVISNTEIIIPRNFNITSPSTGDVFTTNLSSGTIVIGSTTESTSNSTGALQVSGGVGIGSNLYVGGLVKAEANVDVSGNVNVTKNVDITGALVVDTTSTLTGIVSAGANVDVSGNVNVTKNVDVTGALVVDSISTLTGIVSAGANVDVAGNVNVTKNVDVTGGLTVDGTSTLAAITGTSLVLSGDLTVNGTTTTINSNVTTIDDPVIQLGTDTEVDSLDRGIKSVYNDGTAKAAFFGWQRNGANNEFTFIPEATFSSANVATGTVGDAKFYNMDLSGNAIVDGTSTLTGIVSAGANVDVSGNVNVTKNVDVTGALVVDTTSTLTGIVSAGANVDVSGNVNVTKNVDVTGALVVDTTSTLTGAVSAGSTLGVTGATTLSSTLAVTGVSTFTGNAVVNGSLIQSVNEFSDSTGSRTDLWNGSNSAPSKHILLDTAAASLFSSNAVAVGYTTGQTMNLFFTNNSGGTANANIDFGANKLYAGSGLAQYLVFNTTGQSATLIYINASGDNDGWRIINTGGTVH
jgi:predicted acyltransferase (DUF342 family)